MDINLSEELLYMGNTVHQIRINLCEELLYMGDTRCRFGFGAGGAGGAGFPKLFFWKRNNHSQEPFLLKVINTFSKTLPHCPNLCFMPRDTTMTLCPNPAPALPQPAPNQTRWISNHLFGGRWRQLRIIISYDNIWRRHQHTEDLWLTHLFLP